MVFTTLTRLVLVFSLVLLVSCQKEEFFEKNYIAGTDIIDLTPDTEIPILDAIPEVTPTPVVEPTPVVTPTPVIEPTPVVTPTPVIEPTPVVTPTPVVELQMVSEQFTQNASVGNKVDILWVIDNSGSMSDDQISLANNFRYFINGFINKNADFQMAITTTDTTDAYNGNMTCGYNSTTQKTRVCGTSGNISADELMSKLSASAAAYDLNDFIDDFMKFVYVGAKGSGYERGLKATSSFLSKYNQSFLRSDAFLAVIILSDEEDQSPDTVANYVNYIRSHKNNEGMAKIYSIVTKTAASHPYPVTVGNRYMQASEMTGGTHHDIKQDYYQNLLSIGGSIVELLDSFALAEGPYAGTDITVKVNGNVVTSGWTFNSSNNSVKFEQNSLPAEGSIITVEYFVEK